MSQANTTISSPFEASGISIRGARVEYQAGAPTLDDLDVEFAPGEIVALVGASGCGKSTLLRSIAKLLPLAAGEIDFHSGSPSRRSCDLSYVFQDATLLPWRTVFENVRLPLELESQPNQRRVEELSERDRIVKSLLSVGLMAETWHKFPRELSGGMRMRVSIARALVTEPSILLLDEPFAALDDLLRSRLNDLILELWSERARTILFVTHNIAEAIYMSHRVAVLGHGKIARVLENTLPWPREAQQRTSLAFAEQYGAIGSSLAEVAEIDD